MNETPSLTAERARELFRYDPETGKLYWRVNLGTRARVGTEAGTVRACPYRRVGIDGRAYLGHRLAYLIVTGTWPEEIDHIDGDGFNNRWDNLREVSHRENGCNVKRRSTNTSGVTGVGWNKAFRKWRAWIQVGGTDIHLGYFDNLTAAAEARKAAERRHGFHATHGRAA